MASNLTHEQRARRYLQASMHAGYTGLPAEHREAWEAQMRSHERSYKRVREHALVGTDKDFDQPLTAGEREHQQHLRRHHGLQEGDVQRLRKELRGQAGGGERGRSSRAAPSRAGSPTFAGARAGQAAAGAAGSAVTAAATNSGSMTLYILGAGLLLCFVYLLIAGKGAQAFGKLAGVAVGAASAFIKPEDPIAKLETALGATAPAHAAEPPEGRPASDPATPFGPSSGTPITGSKGKFAATLQKLTGLNTDVVDAWLNHEQGSSTVEGGNNWLNVETAPGSSASGPYGEVAKEVERLSPTAAAEYTAQWIARNQPSILASRGQGVAAQIKAIEDSAFAGSHYGYESAAEFLSAG